LRSCLLLVQMQLRALAMHCEEGWRVHVVQKILAEAP